MSKYNLYICNRCLDEFSTSWPCRTDYGIICDDCIEEYAFSNDTTMTHEGATVKFTKSGKVNRSGGNYDKDRNDEEPDSGFVFKGFKS